jgi:AraC-like DNA-binding protein
MPHTAAAPRDWEAAIALREPRFPPLRIAIAVQTLTGEGLQAQALLAGTGLDEQALQDPDVRVSSLQYLLMVNNAVRLGCAPDAGLRVGLRYRASCYGMLGYALMCSASLRQALDTSQRYIRLCNGMFDFSWHEEEDSAVWLMPRQEQMLLPGLTAADYGFLRDMSMAAQSTVVRDVMGPWCIPLRVDVVGPPPAHVRAMARAFECPLHFHQARNALHYPLPWLERAPQLANHITAAQMSRACARMVEDLRWQSGLTRRVYHELTRSAGHFPDIEAVAAALCMTSRTLRRKLEAEGTSYSDLHDKVRHALALDYLGSSMLSPADIAAALGFSDSASFRRAFRRWTGSTPADHRAAH